MKPPRKAIQLIAPIAIGLESSSVQKKGMQALFNELFTKKTNEEKPLFPIENGWYQHKRHLTKVYVFENVIYHGITHYGVVFDEGFCVGVNIFECQHSYNKIIKT